MPPKRKKAPPGTEEADKRRRTLDPRTAGCTRDQVPVIAAETNAASLHNKKNTNAATNKGAKLVGANEEAGATWKQVAEEKAEESAQLEAFKAAESALEAALAKKYPRDPVETEKIKKKAEKNKNKARAKEAAKAKKEEEAAAAAAAAAKQREWEQLFFQLAVFKQKNGHVRFPGRKSAKEKETPLSKWVSIQRSANGKKMLSEDQVAALNSLGFIWNVVKDDYDRAWEVRYQELLAYKEKHGDTHVPMNYEGGLGKWCSRQRSGHKLKQQFLSGRLDKDIKSGKIEEPRGYMVIKDEHFEKLDKLGFKWELYKRDTWEARMEELAEYKKRFGHCNVPQHWPENKCLGKFVARQRYNYCMLKQGKMKWKSMTEERIAQLEAMGFDWGKFRPVAWTNPQTEEAKQEMVEAQERKMESKRDASTEPKKKRPRGRPRKDEDAQSPHNQLGVAWMDYDALAKK